VSSVWLADLPTVAFLYRYKIKVMLTAAVLYHVHNGSADIVAEQALHLELLRIILGVVPAFAVFADIESIEVADELIVVVGVGLGLGLLGY